MSPLELLLKEDWEGYAACAVITGLYLQEKLTESNMVALDPHSAAWCFGLTLSYGISSTPLAS